MQTTTQTLLSSALKKLGIFARGETLTPEDAQDAKLALNFMLASWSIRNVAVLTTAIDTITLTPNVGVYTIGPSVLADFTTDRPQVLLRASLKDTVGIFWSLEVIGEDQYLLYGDRDIIGGLTRKVFYDPTLPDGTLSFYYIPDKAYQVDLYSTKAFADITDLDAVVDLDPSYMEAIIYNLALRLAPDFGREPSMEVVTQAKELFDSLIALTSPDMFTTVDLPTETMKYTTIYTIE